MVLITPALGADSGTWDDKINTAFALIDAHDHTSGKGVAIASAALNINADVSWGGYTISSLGKIGFTAVTAPVTGSKNLFVSSADNELYWRTNAGVNVKLTSGTSINTTLVGGIVGDYATVGAEVAFSDADQVYTFKDQSSPTKKWARLASGPVRIYEYDTTESVYVEHAVATALASSYTVTWPAALPGSTAIMQVSDVGAVVFSNTVPSLTTAGAVIAGSLKYTGPVTTYIPASAYLSSATPPHHAYNIAGYWTWLGTATETISIPVPVTDSETITGFTVYCKKNSDADNTITVSLIKYSSTNSPTTVATATTGAVGAIGDTSMTASFTEAVSGNNTYSIVISASDATPSSDDRFYMTKVTRTRP